jgi:glucose-6-phosphate dehydrogenase assembly protein OpcA
MPGPVETLKVQPEQLLKDLRNLWADLGKEQEHGVLRACAMTFIVVANEADDPSLIGETIGRLMHEHPSRAIVVRVTAENGPQLEARVFAQCWMPFGKRQQICCEQIEITASPSSLVDVITVVRGLIVPDLPVVLYSPDPKLCQTPAFQSMLPLASKLIVDSSDSPDFSPVEYLHRISSPGLRVGDLLWTRMTPWREAVARIFEKPDNVAAAYALENIQMLYTGAEDGPAVVYLAGWFMHVLGAGVHLNVAPGVGPSYAGIARIDLHGPSLEATIDLTDPNGAELRAGDMHQRIVFPKQGECELLRRELAITGRDRIFEDVLGLANLMKGKT